MATIRMVCPKPKGCGRRFSKVIGSRRVYCEECSPPREQRTGPDKASGPAGDAAPGPIERRLLKDLQSADRHETVDGLGALAVARDVDHGRVPCSQKPRVLSQLAKLRDAALDGAVVAGSSRLDDLAKRRRAREAS